MRRNLFLIGGLLAFCFAAVAGFGAIQELGTLTLNDETVVYRTPDKDVVYDLLGCPGLALIKYEKKSQQKGKEDIDISEATFADLDGNKFTLVQGKPRDVTRILDGDRMIWKVSK